MRLSDKILIFIKDKAGIDRLLHVLLSMLLFKVIMFASLFFVEVYLSILISTSLAFGLGLLKEWYDLRTTGRYDKKDLIADLMGICLGLIMII